MKKQIFLLIALAILCCWSSAISQSYKLLQSVIGAGGGQTSSASYTSINTIGQPVVGSSSSSSYSQSVGFEYQIGPLKDYSLMNFPVAGGWNLISLPMIVTDKRVTTIFPQAISKGFSYDNSYLEQDTLIHGIGYWLKFGSAQTISMLNGMLVKMDSIPVRRGWNIIGSIADPMPVNLVVQSPPDNIMSDFFGFDNSYFSIDTIFPGDACWVKCDSPGILIMNTIAKSVKNISRDSINIITQQLNVFKLERQSATKGLKARTLDLFFGKISDAKISFGKFNLPPVPPAGSTDVRFKSNKFVELIPDNIKEPIEIPLVVQSNEEPLKFSWEMKERNGLKYTLLEKKNGKVISQHRLLEKGSVVIEDKNETSYSIKVESVPLKYSLYQNYPNPFNPTTTIRFDLPEPAIVTMKVYDILGREVATPITNQEMSEGQQSMEMDAHGWASGVYLYRITAQSGLKKFVDVKKMMLLK